VFEAGPRSRDKGWNEQKQAQNRECQCDILKQRVITS
jgi:hypothetical protein